VKVYARLNDGAVREARETAQTKMLELMSAAKKRAKIQANKTKQLPSPKR